MMLPALESRSLPVLCLEHACTTVELHTNSEVGGGRTCRTAQRSRSPCTLTYSCWYFFSVRSMESPGSYMVGRDGVWGNENTGSRVP